MKATACLILVWGFFVRLFAFNFNWFDICLFIRSICFYTSKKALWLGQLFSKKMIIFLRYSLNPVCHSVISLFSEVIGSKCFFLLGINNSWFHCCFHEGVPFCGEYWCFWMAQRGLSPCVFAQHWISKGISFLLVPFAGPFQMNKNGSISEWNPAQNSPTATSFPGYDGVLLGDTLCAVEHVSSTLLIKLGVRVYVVVLLLLLLVCFTGCFFKV